MNQKLAFQENIPIEIYRDQDALNKKMEGLIIEFNKKWMGRVCISEESPFVSNEYPLLVKLSKMAIKRKAKKSHPSVHNFNLSPNRFLMDELI